VVYTTFFREMVNTASHQKREISELEQMREISGPCKSILPTPAVDSIRFTLYSRT
jgi:hypothetical protein